MVSKFRFVFTKTNKNLFVCFLLISSIAIFLPSCTIFPNTNRVPPNRVIEEYATMIEPLDTNKINFRVTERIKFNAAFLEELSEIHKYIIRRFPELKYRLDSHDYKYYKYELWGRNSPEFASECFDGLDKFGITELINMETGHRFKWSREWSREGYFNKIEFPRELLYKLEKTAIEMPPFFEPRFLQSTGDYQYYQNEIKIIDSQPTENPLYERIEFLPLNTNKEGYFYLVYKEIKFLFKAKLCTQECPFSKVQTLKCYQCSNSNPST